MISIFLAQCPAETPDCFMKTLPTFLGIGYTVVLPLFLFFYLRRTISKRPGAFTYPDISHHPDLPPEGKFVLKMGDRKYYIPVLPLALIVMFIIMIPGIIYFALMAKEYFAIQDLPDPTAAWKERLEREYDPSVTITVMGYSLCIIWGIGAGLSIYFLGMSYQRQKIRDEIKAMEDEFQIGLFRLGDILSSGMPLESALDEVINKYKQYKLDKSPMYAFFLGIRKNIRDLGMTLKRAIFDEHYGVILHYPSILINDIMQIVASAAQKSSIILSVASKTISSFLLKTKRVEELLKEMLDEVAAAIQVQTNFIAPFICGIVAAMATFIIQLLQKISVFLKTVEDSFNMGGGFVGAGTMKFGDMMNLVKIEEVMPPTIFQLIVGIYMIELVLMLAYFLNGIRWGFDKTTRNVLIGKSLITALIFYTVIVYVGLLMSSMLLPTLGSLGGGVTGT
jgi:hypothetical protein